MTYSQEYADSNSIIQGYLVIHGNVNRYFPKHEIAGWINVAVNLVFYILGGVGGKVGINGFNVQIFILGIMHFCNFIYLYIFIF